MAVKKYKRNPGMRDMTGYTFEEIQSTPERARLPQSKPWGPRAGACRHIGGGQSLHHVDFQP
jgi:hypothetical protein